MDSLIPVIVVQAVGLVATVATVVAVTRNHEKRLDTLEKRIADFPKDYVPRTEVEQILKGIDATTTATKELMQALVYGNGRQG